ncbi:hypothetical protein ACH4ZX_09575 [Streptomyces sp. NPDC020490]|uniref:hypothetical protein n=1 Tax=Streptomyces sp. NPDC020490 TaxID=3365078 RepID=UPI0037B75836
MAEHATHATVLRPVPLRELPAYRRLAVAAPGSALVLLGAALRVVLRADHDGIGALGGVLIVVLLVLAAVGWLGLYVRQRSRNQRLTYADGRLTVTDRRGRSTSVRPVEAVAHGVRGFIGQSVLLVVSGAEGGGSGAAAPGALGLAVSAGQGAAARGGRHRRPVRPAEHGT